jgi:hypothetical protein
MKLGRPASPTPKITRSGNCLILNRAAMEVLDGDFYDIRAVEGGVKLSLAPIDIGRHRRCLHAIPIGKRGYGLKEGDVLLASVFGKDDSITFVKEPNGKHDKTGATYR